MTTPTDTSPAAAASFANRNLVHAWLEKQGYGIAKSTFYKHHNAGLIKAGSDGFFSSEAVQKYIRTIGLLKKGEVKNAVAPDTAQRKAEAEAKRAERQAALLEIKEAETRGELVPRQWAVGELTKRAQLFKGDLENLAHAQAGQIIALVGGDPVKTAELVEHMLEQFAQVLDRYARQITLPVPRLAAVDGAEEEPSA